MSLKVIIVILTVITTGSFYCGKRETASLVLKNGKIVTVDAEFSIHEAVAAAGDKILFVGSDSEVEKYIGPGTEVIDMGGKLVLPGLIDAHVHVTEFGLALENLDFTGTTSFYQIVNMVAEKAKTLEPGEWILGRSWDQNDWDLKEFPVHDALSRVSPDNPVWLERVDMHAGIANRKAIETAGINSRTKEVAGGKIYRKNDGSPSGIFVDSAMDLVRSNIPELSDERIKETIIAAVEADLAVGLTGVQDAGVSEKEIRLFKELIDEGRLKMRINGWLDDPGDKDPDAYIKRNRIIEYGGYMLSVNTVKLFVDGALGSRGAAMLKPYSDDPGNRGLIISDFDHIYKVSKAALANGVQVATHAIGDRANRIALDAYEKALKENPVQDHRFRIEHSQIIAPEDIPRFVSLRVIPSMQPTHATSDMYWVEDRIGAERMRGAYAWQAFLKAGLYIPCGSDCPVESNNPMLGIYAAVTRQDAKGWPEDGFMPKHRMHIREAVQGFTIWAARAVFQDDILGTIEPGKLADFTVLDKDILEIDPIEILSTKAVYTIVGGKVMYKAN